MRLTNYERETIISTLRRRLEQLAQDRPEECRLVKTCHDGQAVEYYIPKKWLRVNPGLNLTDEQRAARAETARKRFSREKPKESTESGDDADAGVGNYISQTQDAEKEAHT